MKKISDITYNLSKLNEKYKGATRYIDHELINYLKEEIMNIEVPVESDEMKETKRKREWKKEREIFSNIPKVPIIEWPSSLL